MQKKHNLLAGFIGLIILVVGFCLAGWIVLRPGPLVLQGEAEAVEVRVSGKLAGRIHRLYVEEGMTVNRGDTLAVIESPELEAKMEQAEAAVAAAEAQNRKALSGTRSEQIAAAYQMWQKAEAGVDIAGKSLARVRNLYAKEVFTAQQLDEAEAHFKAAEATAKAAMSQYDMAVKGAQTEDKQAAMAMVERARGAKDEVESYLNETILRAPISGEVSEIYPRVGELVGSGSPVASIADLDDMWVTFNVREDLLPGIAAGGELNVTVPALGYREVVVKVTYIKALGSYATWKATKMTGHFDAKTFEVRARPVGGADGLRPGMSVLYTLPKHFKR